MELQPRFPRGPPRHTASTKTLRRGMDQEKSVSDYLWLVILAAKTTSHYQTHQISRCRQAAL